MSSKELKQLVVVSGKGGTGKTTVTASLAALAEDKVMADCDVDAANLHLLLKAKTTETIQFPGAKVAVRDEAKCQQAGECERVCRFDAITVEAVSPTKCEGCGLCVLACPHGALRLEPYVCGEFYVADTPYGPLAHGRLFPGAENSGRLVTMVRQKAENLALERGTGLVIIDGPPGIGCTANAAITETNLVLVVTEPTLSAIHDAERLLGLVQHFGLPAALLVNKHDINPANTQQIQALAQQYGLPIVGLLPYDEVVPKSVAQATPLVEFAPDSVPAQILRQTWTQLQAMLG
ncbi:MAG: 4Fe-4S binding protein [Armatimonadetes bacterium]|nr:4Fe-4S binding protein [Armatimonadota bacterium]